VVVMEAEFIETASDYTRRWIWSNGTDFIRLTNPIPEKYGYSWCLFLSDKRWGFAWCFVPCSSTWQPNDFRLYKSGVTLAKFFIFPTDKILRRVYTGMTVKVIIGYFITLRMGIFLFTTLFRTALGPTQPPIRWVPGALSLGVKRPSVKLTIHFHLVPR
jgi:hypothetical protein